MRSVFLLSFLALYAQPHSPVDAATFINPTGTYLLKGEIRKNNITGHFGEIRVRLLDSQTVAFCFYISSGYPDYASGAAIDTLQYEDNNVVHYRPARDSTCFLVLTFGVRSVEIMEVLTDPHSGCGFSPGILVPATFQKVSSETPVIQDLSRRGRRRV
jgi:hypothetical protein